MVGTANRQSNCSGGSVRGRRELLRTSVVRNKKGFMEETGGGNGCIRGSTFSRRCKVQENRTCLRKSLSFLRHGHTVQGNGNLR